MQKLEKLGKVLSRQEQKSILGGTLNDNCSVSCGAGYYACCCAGDCRCINDTDTTDYGCTAGGTGSKSCSYDSGS